MWFAATFFARTGRGISILYRPPKVSLLRKIVGEARQAPGIQACPTTIAGVKKMIRNLKQGHTFGALPDQVPSKGEGVWADFRQACLHDDASCACRASVKADRFFVWGVRSGDGWRIEAVKWMNRLQATPKGRRGDEPPDRGRHSSHA